MSDLVLGDANSLKELLGQLDEPLVPELEMYLEKDRVFGHIIRHPIYYSVPHIYPEMNALANRCFAQLKEQVAKAEAEKDWGRYIFFHQNPHRFAALVKLAIHGHIESDAEFWELFGDTWGDCENLWQHRDNIKILLGLNRPGREHLMRENERAALAELPHVVTIYRGHNGRNPNGMSWTLDRSKARWFAERFPGPREQPRVRSATIHRDEIDAYFTRRGESEVVLFRGPHAIAKLSTEPKTGYERKTRDGRSGMRYNTKPKRKQKAKHGD